MTKFLDELQSSIATKVEGDADFQNTLAGLSDDEKSSKVSERVASDLETELASLKEKAEKAGKAEELAQNYKIRAEKAEKKGMVEAPKTDGTLSTKDTLALIAAKIDGDDFDEVVSYASFRKVSISEVLKDKTLQTVLRERGEERATAAATNARGKSRMDAAPAPDMVIASAQKGVLPTDDTGINELVNAEMNVKLKKARLL